MKCALGMLESASLCPSLDLGVACREGGWDSVLRREMKKKKKICGEKTALSTELRFSSSFSGF